MVWVGKWVSVMEAGALTARERGAAHSVGVGGGGATLSGRNAERYQELGFEEKTVAESPEVSSVR